MPKKYTLEPKVFGEERRLSLSFDSLERRSHFEEVVRSLGATVKRNRRKREKPIDRFVFQSQAHADLTAAMMPDVLAVAGFASIEILAGQPGKPTARLVPLPFPAAATT